MLPRLRFVIAALTIAVLPWLLLGTGAAMRGRDTAPASELSSSRGTLLRGAMLAADEAQQLQVFAYARRSEELNRLRELATAPLPNWIAAPTGGPAVEATKPDAEPAGEPSPRDDTVLASVQQTETVETATAPAAAALTVTGSLADDPALIPAVDAPPPVDTALAVETPLTIAAAPAAAAAATEEIQLERIPIPVARPRLKGVSPARKRSRIAAVTRAQSGHPNRPAPSDSDISNPFSGLFNLP